MVIVYNCRFIIRSGGDVYYHHRVELQADGDAHSILLYYFPLTSLPHILLPLFFSFTRLPAALLVSSRRLPFLSSRPSLSFSLLSSISMEQRRGAVLGCGKVSSSSARWRWRLAARGRALECGAKLNSAMSDSA